MDHDADTAVYIVRFPMQHLFRIRIASGGRMNCTALPQRNDGVCV